MHVGQISLNSSVSSSPVEMHFMEKPIKDSEEPYTSSLFSQGFPKLVQ